ncbi:MAG TPA: PAS domain-containing protein [Candidatus Sulfotelmatobacter sp.]|jgi:PAS domain S-box-containing protein
MAAGSTSIFRSSGTFARYVIAILAVIVAIYLRVLMAPLFHGNVPYHMIWAAIAFTAWRCGLGPSILATFLSLIAVSFHMPFLPNSNVAQTGAIGMASFVIFSGIIVAVGENSRRVIDRGKNAEREARRSRILFETFMDNSPGAAFMKDRDGKYVYINRTARERLKLPLVVGKTDFDVFPAEAASAYRANDLEVLRDGKPREFLEYVDQPDGKRAWLSIRFLVTDPDGKVFVCGKSFDVTDRINAQEALLEAHHELEERVKKRTVELTVARDSLRDLSARLLQVRDEERRRIARELHDSVGQLLAALAMNIAALNRDPQRLPPDVARMAAESISLLDQANREIRTMSHLLHPPLLDEVGLESTLRWYVDGFTERSGIQVGLQISVGAERLPQETELTVFRVVQECLANIHRHSSSKTASIRIEFQDGWLNMQIKDAGKGIPAEKQIEGLDGQLGVGIRGMRERLRLLGGTLEIESNSAGTTVRAMLPASREARLNPPRGDGPRPVA